MTRPPESPALARLAELQAPTPVIDGIRDWSENRRASRLLDEGIPGARRIEVEGGRVAPLEDPAGFADLWKERWNGRAVTMDGESS